MRSSILLSALAIGAIASPLLDKRYYITEVDLEIKTVTVYVTPGAPEPTAAAVPSYGQRHRHSHSKAPVPAPSSKAAPKPSSVYTPPPAYTPPPTPIASPVQSSKAPASSAPAYNGAHKSGPIQATFSSGPDYQAMVLYHHNAVRANHGAAPLVWDSAVESAAAWSANKCEFKHQFESDGLNMGQNIFATSGNSFNVSGGIIESWYKGELPKMQGYWGVKDLNGMPDVFEGVGHLTAMVWKKTTKVGCASVNCANNPNKDGTIAAMNMFTVCNYQEPGNVQDQYAENVQAPISMSNLPKWDD
ncbi:CAP domain-containing protein [Clohesyomyces aquaticus]|uniref:CAP domain-containing protein n=1 Tax=Clohesyomyces aquaticus TaxID=1231657 RepID=A0A1Y2A6M2_9PLEO|nr:CAP domain-containing protein [Clohesyomyces aquaticus]